MKSYCLQALACYWSERPDLVAALPIPEAPGWEAWRPRLAEVVLPHEQDPILVPEQAARADWREVPWWHVLAWYLTGAAERAHEQRHGPIHSYSWSLEGFDPRMWEAAWANRIALFLRHWAGGDPGPLPRARFHLTHDVDAVRKTLAIRLKQTAFHLYNRKLGKALRFFFSTPGYWCFEEIQQLEQSHDLRSTFFFYGGRGGPLRSPRLQLFDPDYDVSSPRLKAKLAELLQGGWQVGLHQSFGSWQDSRKMRAERAHLEEAAGRSITACRQHWLRFSWGQTWQAQHEAGLALDMTLGFNDRPGFRTGAALSYCLPGTAHRLVPMILMDSQLHDYQSALDWERWLAEVVRVGGEASLIWHQQTFSTDYGWGDDYRRVLDWIARNGSQEPP